MRYEGKENAKHKLEENDCGYTPASETFFLDDTFKQYKTTAKKAFWNFSTPDTNIEI